jgi:hypothetical protein
LAQSPEHLTSGPAPAGAFLRLARRGTLAPRAECFCTHASVLTPLSPSELRTEVPVIVERIVLPKLPLNWSGYADGAIADAAIADAAITKCLSLGPGSYTRSTAGARPALPYYCSESRLLGQQA